jgi:hypothetical protein
MRVVKIERRRRRQAVSSLFTRALLQVVPAGSGSTASRSARFFGHILARARDFPISLRSSPFQL